MQPDPRPNWLTVHPVTPEDSALAPALRSAAAPVKGRLTGTAAREPFDEIMQRVALPAGVAFEAATIGGISGWWAKPATAPDRAAIMHVHGGWFNFGSAQAYRNFAGHIASSAGTNVFIPDYRLAPEHPFPAAVHDLEACYWGLVAAGVTRIALSGDSAGGNLALVLLALSSAQVSTGSVAPAGAVVFSPVTDLALTGESYETRAEADPYFTKSQAAGLVQSYLGQTDPTNPFASPLYDDLAGLPPIRVHVGDDEVLLDDSRRYVERAAGAGVAVRLDVWMGMPHGFVSNIGGFKAAAQALEESGTFLRELIFRMPDQSKAVATEEEIRRRAHEIYVARGEEPGHDVEDWLQAERELTNER